MFLPNSLHSSNLKDEGLKLLYYSLINNSNFKSLDIGDCKLTDKSVEFIREIIHRREHDHGLNELIISSNPKITLTGWSQILISVSSASDLEHFYLDFNNLDDSCGYLIAAMLSANHMLKTLDLEHTGLTSKTASLLLYMFRNYQLTIKSLNLINNNIDEHLLKEIQTFTENINCTNILLKENNVSHLVEESVVLNESYDLKMRDQVKLDEYIRNGQKLDFNNLSLVSDYEKKLEQDFKSLLNEKNKIDNKQLRKNSSEAEEYEQEEVLKPVKNSDQRYKTHTVLPMNYLE